MINLKKHGDILEKTYYDNILVNIPLYEELWKKIIGNNGNAKIIESNDGAIDKFRRFIAQHSYTIFESLVCLFRITQKETNVNTLDEYLNANNDFILFQTHCGRIRDCVHKIGTELKLDKLENNLENFYKIRNQVLHGKKLPFTFIEEMFVLPKVSGKNINPDYWDDNLLWEDINPKEMEIVDEIYKNLYSEMIACLNSVYSKILTEIKNKSELNKIISMMDNYIPNDNNYVISLGIQDNHLMADRILQSASGSLKL
jgi:hypothetical protein